MTALGPGLPTLRATASFEHPVSTGESRRAHEERQSDPANRSRLERLVDELERDRADQEPGTKRHDDRYEPPTGPEFIGNDCAGEQSRGSEGSPAKGLDVHTVMTPLPSGGHP